jgi:hypothetical protein
MSHSVLLLLGLLMLWAFLRWRRSHGLRWALAVGLLAGWAAITRPADALCYALPIGLAMLWDLRRAAWGDRLRMAGTIVAGAAPFLVLQVIFNIGVTGKPFESPYRFYLDRDAPQLSFGFHEYDPTRTAKSVIPQKRIYHRDFNGSLIRAHRPENLLETWFDPSIGRLRLIMESTSPSLILAPLMLVGLLGLTTSHRVALFIILPLYCVFYLFYAALLRHYTPAIAPATILIGVLGVRQVEWVWLRARAAVSTLAVASLVGICIVVLPEMNPQMKDDPFPYPEVTDARENIPKSVKRPALVFVTFVDRAGENVHAEPVYNYDAARIDDNPILYVHDLGPRNIELVWYYLQHQPDRQVYRYDRTSRRLIDRGSLMDELNRLTAAAAATQRGTTAPAAPK